MKNTLVTSTILATLLAITPAFAEQQNKEKHQQHTPKSEEKCLESEIQRLESSLNNIGKAIDSRMKAQAKQLADSQAALTAANAMRAELEQKLAASEARSKNITSEFEKLKTATEKHRQAALASINELQENSKKDAHTIRSLKEQNTKLDSHCKAACERLKTIADNLSKVETELAKEKD